MQKIIYFYMEYNFKTNFLRSIKFFHRQEKIIYLKLNDKTVSTSVGYQRSNFLAMKKQFFKIILSDTVSLSLPLVRKFSQIWAKLIIISSWKTFENLDSRKQIFTIKYFFFFIKYIPNHIRCIVDSWTQSPSLIVLYC